ncbi:MAG: hypothetical protein AAF196_15205 [Planctomycetota bacterium]
MQGLPRAQAPVVPQPEPFRPKPVTTATLRDGETLSGLCGRVLGATSRWREVAELNGWDEEDLKRLLPGVSVKLPAN